MPLRQPLLFDDLGHDAGADGAAALADGEAQAFFHRNRVDQLDRDADVVARHHHLLVLGQLDRAGHVRRAEVELRAVVVEERRVAAAFFLAQHVDLGREVRVRLDTAGLAQHLAALDVLALGAAQQDADVVARLALVEQLAEHLHTRAELHDVQPALAQLAAADGEPVLLWAREPEVISAVNLAHENRMFLPGIPLSPSIEATTDLGRMDSCDALLVVAPAQYVARVLAGTPVGPRALVLCAKGIEASTGRLMTEVASTLHPRAPIAVLCKPGSVKPHTHFTAEIYVLSKDEGGRHTPFFNNYRPQFYFRTTDVTGAIELPEGKEMVMPGDNVSITVKLINPIAMEEGLRFAIREGGRTVGAGVVAKILA